MKICIVVNISFVLKLWLIYILGEMNYEVFSVIKFLILRINVLHVVSVTFIGWKRVNTSNITPHKS